MTTAARIKCDWNESQFFAAAMDRLNTIVARTDAWHEAAQNRRSVAEADAEPPFMELHPGASFITRPHNQVVATDVVMGTIRKPVSFERTGDTVLFTDLRHLQRSQKIFISRSAGEEMNAIERTVNSLCTVYSRSEREPKSHSGRGRASMTKFGVAFMATAACACVALFPARADAWWWVARQAASTCQFLGGGQLFVSDTNADGDIDDAHSGRIRSLTGQGSLDSVAVLCPVVDMPVYVVDITDTSQVNYVSVEMYQGTWATSGREARAQLCSEDESYTTYGGSCDPSVRAPTGASVRRIDIQMLPGSEGSNWQRNPGSFHYIYAKAWSGDSTAPAYAYFSGYILWHN